MSAGPILEFRGEHRFLSNFWMDGPFRVPSLRADAASVEHAFQAFKCVDPADLEFVLSADQPGLAKSRGRSVTLRRDWEVVKQDAMLACLRAKFDAHDRELVGPLLGTGYRLLVEGNDWDDTTWGATWGWEGSGGVGPCWSRSWWGEHSMVGEERLATKARAGVPGTLELRGENWLGRLLMLVRAELDCGIRR